MVAVVVTLVAPTGDASSPPRTRTRPNNPTRWSSDFPENARVMVFVPVRGDRLTADLMGRVWGPCGHWPSVRSRICERTGHVVSGVKEHNLGRKRCFHFHWIHR